MDVFEAIRSRRSTRSYQTKPVEEEKLANILEAAKLAPSAANTQPCSFIIVKSAETKERLSQAYSRPWFRQAPIIIVVCAEPEKAWKRADGEEFWKIDAAIAMQTLVLAATAEGLGTCWIGAFDEKIAKEALEVPQNVRIVAMTPLGYSAQKSQPSERKPLVETVHENNW